jgi:predicted TIM-barrel fold metal-dependent hydrolase
MVDVADAIPLCPGPDPAPHGPTRYVVPPGAVDCQAHVIGSPPAYPYVPQRSYTPPEASTDAYLHMLDATGMTYGVLIQVSIHGTDNRFMLEALRAHPRRLRGIAVAPLGLPTRAYESLRESGVVGLRLNTLFGGGIGLDEIEEYGALCRDLGWHLQFLLDARNLPPLASRLGKLPVPFIVDHMGHFPTSTGVASEATRTLVDLVRDGAWVKLSGAFRNTAEGPPYSDTVPFARLLAEAAPDRCVWGSDWPHPAHWGPMMNVGDLLDLLADWVPDEPARHRILVENPGRLYGFAPVSA